MRAIIINAEERAVSEAEIDGSLDSLQEIVGGLIDPVYPGLVGTNHHCYINDEGLLNNPQHFFMLKDGHQPLAGNGVILSTTPDGDEAPCALPLHWIKERVTFMDLQAVREWVAREPGQEVFGSFIDEADITDSKAANEEALADDALMHAKEQGQSQYESIREMVVQLKEDEESARNAILKSPLSTEVRSDWYVPGEHPGKPDEFEILLCTGGPAVRLVGDLDPHGEPESVTMQVQDWFQPWTDFQPYGSDADVLLTYARCFHFDGHSDSRVTDSKATKKEALAEARAETEQSIADAGKNGRENSR